MLLEGDRTRLWMPQVTKGTQLFNTINVAKINFIKKNHRVLLKIQPPPTKKFGQASILQLIHCKEETLLFTNLSLLNLTEGKMLQARHIFKSCKL